MENSKKKTLNLQVAAELILIIVLLIIVLISGLLSEPALMAMVKHGWLTMNQSDLFLAVRVGMILGFILLIDMPVTRESL